MTVEDVHLGSPNEPLFQLISRVINVDNRGEAEFRNCTLHGVPFDGLVYRSVERPPTEPEAKQIGRQFQKRVKELTTSR
jgi:hypothetical protein